MADRTRGGRALKSEALNILRIETLDRVLEELVAHPLRQVINPLFSFLLHEDERIRWRAVLGMGAVVSALADRDKESARVIMRRLMWSLNDESGGIGWGAPEAMSEISARHSGMAEEFSAILVSYLNPDGNYLEHPVLQRGLLWAIARMSCARPERMTTAVPFLPEYLELPDAVTRGLAAWACGLLGADTVTVRLEQLTHDETDVRLYAADTFRLFTVGELARRALSLLARKSDYSETCSSAFQREAPGELCL